MKKYIITVIVGVLCSICQAQESNGVQRYAEDSVPACAGKAETVRSICAKQHDVEWYECQARNWRKVVEEKPYDQWAWRNLFLSTYYADLFSNAFGETQDESETADVIRKMEERLPDSFVLNLCKARFCLTTDEAAARGENIPRAVELMPKDAYVEDVNNLACHLWRVDPENPRVSELFCKVYKGREYPARIMKYNWNMLQSMEPGAIYFANGDNALVPMRILQDALGIRKDVTIIPLSFLLSDEYRAVLSESLHIKPFERGYEEYAQYGEKWDRHYLADMAMHVIRESKRPAFFFADVLTHVNMNGDSLYNEGLLLKYSDKQYDNFAVAMRNVKSVYHLDYLTEPDFEYDSWETSTPLDLNNVTLLANLIGKFRRKGDAQQAERLYGILDACIKRSNAAAETKAMMENYLKAEAEK